MQASNLSILFSIPSVGKVRTPSGYNFSELVKIELQNLYLLVELDDAQFQHKALLGTEDMLWLPFIGLTTSERRRSFRWGFSHATTWLASWP